MNLTDCINILHNYFESPNYKIFSIKKIKKMGIRASSLVLQYQS